MLPMHRGYVLLASVIFRYCFSLMIGSGKAQAKS